MNRAGEKEFLSYSEKAFKPIWLAYSSMLTVIPDPTRGVGNTSNYMLDFLLFFFKENTMNVGVGWGGGGALLCCLYMKVLVGS